MHTNTSRTAGRNREATIKGAWIAGVAALILGAMTLAMPAIALAASLRGVAIWWEVLFPALFPFFVLSELLLGFGIVHFAGVLLDPYMRPLFRIPGVGGFVMSMGCASGYPVGAKLTSQLMEQRLMTRNEGERLVIMTTTSDPIFLIGAVSIGFFGTAAIAPTLAVAHYGGALLVGLIARWTGRKGEAVEAADSDKDKELAPAIEQTAGHGTHVPAAPLSPPRRGGRWRAALAAMHRARLEDGRPFGLLLMQSLSSSLTLMIVVGGLVVFFSAALELLLRSGALVPLRQAAAALLQTVGLTGHLSSAYVNGLFEVTLGAQAAADGGIGGGSQTPLIDRAAVAAFGLSWAGLSVHAQVAGLMSRTGWRYGPFARARLLHGLMAMAIVYAIWPFMSAPSEAAAAWAAHAGGGGMPLQLWPPLFAAAVLVILVVAGKAASLWRGSGGAPPR